MYIAINKKRDTNDLIIYRLTYTDKLYLLSTFLIGLNCIIRKSLLGYYTSRMSLLTYISWACMMFRLLSCKHSSKSFIVCLIFIVVAAICFFDTGELILTVFLLRVFAAENIDERKIVRVSFYSFIIGFFIVITSSFIGIVPLLDNEGNYIMGFANINTIGGFIGLFIIIIIYLKYDRLKFFNFIEFIIINSFLLYWTGNRTTCFAVFGIISLTWYLKRSSMNKKTVMYWATGVIILLALLLMIGIIGFKNTLLYINIDKILTGRLFQGNYYYSKYQVSLWGNYIPELLSESWHLVLDMGYAHLIMLRGVIFSAIFILALYGSIIQRIKSKDIPAFLLLFYVALHLLIESFFCDMNLNIAIVFFCSFFSGRHYRNCIIKKK